MSRIHQGEKTQTCIVDLNCIGHELQFRTSVEDAYLGFKIYAPKHMAPNYFLQCLLSKMSCSPW